MAVMQENLFWTDEIFAFTFTNYLCLFCCTIGPPCFNVTKRIAISISDFGNNVKTSESLFMKQRILCTELATALLLVLQEIPLSGAVHRVHIIECLSSSEPEFQRAQ